MKKENYNKATELISLIETIEKAISDIGEFVPEARDDQRTYDDKCYWLSISEHADGFGKHVVESFHRMLIFENLNGGVDLYRYFGNHELLNSIQSVLKNQLDSFKAKLESL